jgi:hypothetical protein
VTLRARWVTLRAPWVTSSGTAAASGHAAAPTGAEGGDGTGSATSAPPVWLQAAAPVVVATQVEGTVSGARMPTEAALPSGSKLFGRRSSDFRPASAHRGDCASLLAAPQQSSQSPRCLGFAPPRDGAKLLELVSLQSPLPARRRQTPCRRWVVAEAAARATEVVG